ncbi:hypothetical protein JCM24511_06105 [Saitozyma sp. JCM 24511]|nr:hypothetical protein JCM24511_06105 [Saitozyma sp. JCM 24511]
MRTPSATIAYSIFVGCLLLLVFWRPPTGFDSLTVGYGSHFPATRVDLAEVLTRVPPGHETFAWARNDGNENGFVVLGTEAAFVEIDEAELIDARTGKPLVGANEGHTFNLAVLKLPHGSRWGFLGVARGPTRRRSLIVVNGHESREQVLVAFGMNMSSDGSLHPVTVAQTLDLPMTPKKGCERFGHWVATYGAEDPRLFWTDAGTPSLTFARNSDDDDTCRNLGFIADLRELYPPLGDAILPTGGVRVQSLKVDQLPGDNGMYELVRKHGQGYIWVFPFIHYSLAADLSIEPTDIQLRRVVYEDIPQAPSETLDCIQHNHWSWGNDHFHQATPLYRLTLCPRGCIPDEHNTVLFTLGQMEARPTYGKSCDDAYGRHRFLSTYNVSAPHNLISVGPQFTFTGLDDVHHINYVLSLTPVEPADRYPSAELIPPRANHLPDHFFIDDDMLVAMGHKDDSMVTTVVPVREALGRQRMCQ